MWNSLPRQLNSLLVPVSLSAAINLWHCSCGKGGRMENASAFRKRCDLERCPFTSASWSQISPFLTNNISVDFRQKCSVKSMIAPWISPTVRWWFTIWQHIPIRTQNKRPKLVRLKLMAANSRFYGSPSSFQLPCGSSNVIPSMPRTGISWSCFECWNTRAWKIFLGGLDTVSRT